VLTAAAFQHTNRHVRHHLHRLGTRRPASTVPGARRPPVTTARASSSALLAEIVTGLAGIAERFATALNGVDTGLLADGVLDQSPTRVPARCHPGRRRRPAQTADARRTLGRARPRPAPHGFTVGDFAAKVPTITGTSNTEYTIRQAGIGPAQTSRQPARRQARTDAPPPGSGASRAHHRRTAHRPRPGHRAHPRRHPQPTDGAKTQGRDQIDRDYEQLRSLQADPLDDLALTTPAPLAG